MAKGEKALPTKAHVLTLLAGESRAFHAREIAERLGVTELAYPGLLRLLDDLAFEGTLTALGKRFALSKRSRRHAGESREGFISIAPRGFGFVSSAEHEEDVYVPRESIGGAMHGDRVEVAIRARSARGVEGEITRIIERRIKRVAGVLRRKARSAWLEPDDTRIRGPIVLTSDVDVRGPEGNSGLDGDAAVATITQYPERFGEQPRGRLEAVLGKPGELSVEVIKVLVREQIDELHSDEAIAEAEAYGEEVPEEMLEGREDLTAIPLPTIDPEDARDHDDAIWVERSDRGGYRAWIAIADVSSYVRPGTHLDREARKRGCSIYLPDRAIPMLPRALSSNLCSLLPDVVRLCLCAIVDLDAGGNVRSHRLVRGYMKSAAKLTYGGVARALGLSAIAPREPKAEKFLDNLRVAYELTRILRAKRMRRGALDFELPEPKMVMDAEGHPIGIERRTRDPGVKKAYELVEELMLLANETVAKHLAERSVPTIYRVHGPPDEAKVERFVALCQKLGIEADMDDVSDAKRLSTLLKDIAEHPRAPVLSMLLLRSMKQASYDIVNIGHFGLASPAYVHFTSPIRRYPDLVVHRGVHATLLGERPSKTLEADLGQAAHESSVSERRSMEIEREVLDLYRAKVMERHVGEKIEGMITAFVGSGAYVALDDPFADVLMRFEDMGGDWETDDDGLRATSRSGQKLELGERLLVEIVDVSIVRRTVYGKPASELERARGHRREKLRREEKQRKGRDREQARDRREEKKRGRR
jgi:ribonuclease R